MTKKSVVMKFSVILTSTSLLNCASAIYTFSKDTHIYNDNPENRIYIGTRLDVNMIQDNKAHGGPLIQTMGALDLPFSLALDTIFLPYTLTRYILSPPAPWTRDEIISWYRIWVKGNPKQLGKFYYRGSDKDRHHFLARPTDKWVLITCKKGSVELPKGLEYPFEEDLTKMKPVDPDNGFSEVIVKQEH